MIGKSLFAPALATTAVALGALSLPAQAKQLTMTACFPRTHDYVATMFETFLNPINKKKGPVTVKYLGGPEVTPWRKQAQSLKRGLVDIIFCPGAYYGGQMAAARLPGAHNMSLDEIRANGGWDMMQKAWGNGLNAHILAWTHFKGQRFYIYTRFEPKLSKKTGIDLSGRKMRVTGLYKAFMKAMGATPVVIKPSEVYSALERGVVDGLAWPWGSIATYGWERFLKYRIEPDFFGASMLMLVNKKKYDGLSKAEKNELEAFARQYEKDADEVVSAKGRADDAKLWKAGVQRVELKGEYRKAYIDTIYGAKWAENDSYADKINKLGVDYKTLKSKLYDPNK